MIALALTLLLAGCGDKDPSGDSGSADTDADTDTDTDADTDTDGGDTGTDTDADTDTDTDTDGGDTDTDTDADTDTDGGDTGTDTDADTDTDGGDTDTDTDTDGGDTGSGDLTRDATFRLTGDTEGQALALLPVTNIGDKTEPIFHEPVAIVAAAPSVTVTVAPPDADLLQQIDPTNPDFQIAFYVPARFVDADGDLQKDEDEAWYGVGTTWLTWVEPPVPSELASFVGDGWNALAIDFDGTSPFFPADIEDVPVPANLVPDDGITLAGTWEAAEPPGPLTRLALVPPVIEDGPVGRLLHDAPLGESFSFTISEPPPADHYGDLDGSGYPQAGEFILVYEDSDESGDLGLTSDALRFSACHDGDVAVLLYADPLTRILDALYAAISETDIGWNAYADPDGAFRRLSDAELASLTVSEACTLE